MPQPSREPIRDQVLITAYGPRVKWRQHRFSTCEKVCKHCRCEFTMAVRDELNFLIFICYHCGNPFVVKKKLHVTTLPSPSS